MSRRRGPLASRAKPYSALKRDRSSSREPARLDSSPAVNTNCTSPCAILRSFNTCTASNSAAKPALSSLPNTVVPSDTMYPSRMDGRTPLPGETVSMCAVKKMVGTPFCDPFNVAIKLPAACPLRSAESSSTTSNPRRESFLLTRRKCDVRVWSHCQFETSSINVSIKRRRFTTVFLLPPLPHTIVTQKHPEDKLRSFSQSHLIVPECTLRHRPFAYPV